jgi:hypothetical protein
MRALTFARDLASTAKRLFRRAPLGVIRILVGVVFVIRCSPLVRAFSPWVFYREGPLWGWPDGSARVSLLGLVPPAGLVGALAIVRIVAGVAFTCGVRARTAGIVAAFSGWFLLASEPLSFIHTVHALHLSVLFIALGDGPSELALRPDARTCKATSLGLLRAHIIAIYAFAATAKFDSTWLSGETLHTLARYGGAMGPLGPIAFATLDRARACAWAALALETALPVLLSMRRWRRVGACVALAMHVGFEVTVRPDVLGLLACALLLAFLADDDAALPADADLAA